MVTFDKYDAELVALRQLVRRKREHYPELTLEECVHMAVDEMNDPRFEKDSAYAHFLGERERKRALPLEGPAPNVRRKKG